MNIDHEAIKILSNTIVNAIDKIKDKLPFDRTVKGTVISVIDTKHYIVKIEGGDYALPSLSNDTFSIGNSVLVTYFQNNKNKAYIIGKEEM